jgi:hypothetical protein
VSRIRTYRNVVDSLQSGAIGTLTESGASTTRFKVGLYLHTFPSGLPTAVDGAGQPVLRANPGGSLISLPGRVGRADLGAGDTCTVASGKAVVTSKVATRRASTRAQGERVGRVAASGGSGGDLGVRRGRCESRGFDSRIACRPT